MKATHPMKSGFLVVLIILATSTVCYGLDTDLYVVSGVNIPPNVLIILDSSASLDEVDQDSGDLYTPTKDYAADNPPIVYPRYAVYIKTGSKWEKWVDDVNSISCLGLKTLLLEYGEAINYSGCGINKKDFQTGNFRNYFQLTQGQGANRPRFGLATGIIKSYINTTGGVRFALMTFNNDATGKTVKYDSITKEEYVPTPDGNEEAHGARLLGFVDENKAGKTELFNNLAGLKNETWSPLAESLYEGGIFFQRGTSAITGTNYASSPIQYYCQKNYVLIISDGNPTRDSHPILNSLIGDMTKDGQLGKLDDVAKYLHGLDLSNGQSSTGQNIKTYTIGFSAGHTLLQNTARAGGGKYFYVYSSQSFNVAFQTFIAEVLQESTSYVAPVVPISQMENFKSGNQMYLAMFKPTPNSFWKGNIKKYGIASENSGNIKAGDILDANGLLAMIEEIKVIDSREYKFVKISEDARSYWSSMADGEDVEKGGVGEILQKRSASRNIYTYLGNTNLSDISNAFSTSNNAITPTLLGLSAGDTTGRDNVINFIHGFDSYNESNKPTPDPTAKRSWILGSFIHSRPVVVHYGTTSGSQSILFAGSNDGMLHAFDNATGEELWAFIPPNLLSNLKNLTGEALQFLVDGAPRVYLERKTDGTLEKAILIFGLRRGGNRYVALDVKIPASPKLLWEITPSTTGFGELGQTWSTPQLGKIKYGSGEKWVAFIGGGYDENQDNIPVTANDTKGRAVYVIDVLTGSLLWSYSRDQNANMKYSIPSDIARVDTNGDGYVDRLYVGDMGGQVWRFDIGDPDSAKWTAKIIFDSNPGSSDKRKIFYPPDVSLEKGNYEMLFFGTGDREAPKSTTAVNRLYAVKDKNPSTVLTENDLVNVTDDLLQDPSATSTQKTDILNSLSTKSGWYIKLDQNAGEKCLSNSVLFYGVIYYTTFTPDIGDPGDPCFLSEGKGRLYALNYKTGEAVFNMDGISVGGMDITKEDRAKIIGPSIPSGVIITFIGNESVAYAGVGGGVYRPPMKKTKNIIPIHWRTVSK
ncbi:MAG: PilC/PilY family type IV pilus protein [Thermodesulfobacteriota bacterium]|nr:PilC/PilY family type IV pilus protein [Thermodesulfobacteriota bacterium]